MQTQDNNSLPAIQTLPKTDFTDKEIFENLKPKLSKKYGEEVIEKLSSEYSQGRKFDLSVQEGFEETIRDKASNYAKELKTEKERYEVYKAFNMEQKQAEDALREIYQNDLELKSLNEKELKTLLDNPAFIKSKLISYQEKKKVEDARISTLNNPASQPDSRLNELAAKRSSGKHLNINEIKEYHTLLENKYLKK